MAASDTHLRDSQWNLDVEDYSLFYWRITREMIKPFFKNVIWIKWNSSLPFNFFIFILYVALIKYL